MPSWMTRGPGLQGRSASGDVAAIAAVSQALGISILVNVGSLRDQIPEGVSGVGLVRTELLFAGRTSAPTESEQTSALLAIARAARGNVVTARLWDAGGDKPLPWLPATGDDLRGAALLFAHPTMLSDTAQGDRASLRARVDPRPHPHGPRARTTSPRYAVSALGFPSGR